MFRRILLTTLLIVSVCVTSCVRDNTITTKDSNPNSPTPIIPVTHTVEFRVLGTINLATITASNSQEGMEIVQSGLPWFQSITIKKDTFLYLDAQSFEFGTIQVQILVDGVLFREAFSTGFSPKIAVSGTIHF